MQIMLEITFARKCSGPHALPVLGALDLGSCIVVVMPHVSHGGMYHHVRSAGFQELAARDPEAAGSMVMRVVFQDCAEALALMNLRCVAAVPTFLCCMLRARSTPGPAHSSSSKQQLAFWQQTS
jgi:hypothetical protein